MPGRKDIHARAAAAVVAGIKDGWTRDQIRNDGLSEAAGQVAGMSGRARPVMTVNQVAKSGRLFEWMTSCMMLGMAVVIAINPQTVKAGGFYLMARIGLTAPVLALLFTFVGCVRVAALVANGVYPVAGPRARAACALFSAALWSQMMVALFAWSAEQNYLSIGVPVYLFLTVGELISCYRAATDVRPVKHS